MTTGAGVSTSCTLMLIFNAASSATSVFAKGVLVVAQGQQRQHVRAPLFEPGHGGLPAGAALQLDQTHVGVERLERSGDRVDQRPPCREREGDQPGRAAVDLEREVVLAAPQPPIPARRDRPHDSLKGLLDAKRVGEVIAAQPQLEGRQLPR